MQPSYLFIFIAGFIALCATLLPGVSGSYILLILGQYEFIISSIHMVGERLLYLASFAIGAILGVMTISRVISYALHKWKSPTLYLLIGLVLGSLNTPIRQILAEEFIWGIGSFIFCTVLFIAGVGGVLWLEKLSGDGKVA